MSIQTSQSLGADITGPNTMDRPVHEDPYPSKIAMEAAVELEVHSALGRVQTQTIGKIIQRAIERAYAARTAG